VYLRTPGPEIPTCAVVLDLSKAFDTVDHSVLLWKLEHRYGIRGLPLQLKIIYIGENIVNKCRSQTQQINCGLPQGSILSPLVFSLYVNDLPKVSNFKTTLFADDTCLILANKSIGILEKMVDQEINKVDSWMCHNKLSLNYSKTVYMIFNSDKKQRSPFRVKIGSNLINRANSTIYLGMHLDHKLNWDTHISKLESKLSCHSGIFYKIREYFSTNELKMIYFSLVYSHLQYAIVTWGSATKTSLHRLNTLHHKIIKTISWSSYRCHVRPLYSQLNLLKLEDIHQLGIAKLMQNFHSNRMPNTFDRLFTAVNSVHTHETRSSTSGQCFCHPVCSQYGKRSIQFKGPKIWQQIDSSLKELLAIIFKK